jgi:hypothetical protein
MTVNARKRRNNDSSNIRSRKVRVDRTMAELFLSFEKQPEKGVKGTNRRFNPQQVQDYAADILADEWPLTHQGMAFYGFIDDGTAEFFDGGQRCRAVILAATQGAGGYPANPDASIEVIVTEGLSRESRYSMDIGRRRTPGQILQMEGEVNTNLLASAIMMCWLYDNVPWKPGDKEPWKGKRLSGRRRQEYLEKNPGIRDSLLEASRVGEVMTVSSATAGHYLATQHGVRPEDLKEFMDALRDGVNLDKQDARLVLREMLLKSRKAHRHWSRDRQLALFIKGLCKWLDGEEVKQLSFKISDAFPRFTD